MSHQPKRATECSAGLPTGVCDTPNAVEGPEVTSRRQFLRAAGIATAGALLAPSARSRAYAVSPPRVIGANDRILVGLIGCGGRGMEHARIMESFTRQKTENLQLVAVCDIYEPRKERARTRTGGTLHHDYRSLLDSSDVDAVFIATPEHWHARMAIDALEAGKDLYLEKPMVRYLDEGRKLYQTVRRTGRVVQIGSQASSQDKWQKAAALVRAGKIGKPVWSQTSYCRNSVGGEWNYRIDDTASPDNLDWKAFLGPAPKRAFDKERFFRWRKYWDYSAGITSDLFPHVMHPLFISLDLDFPTRVTATGGIYVHPDREVPDTIHLLADFPSGHTMVVAGSTANEQGLETMIRGHKANMYLGGREIVIRPERTYSEEIEESHEPAPGGESTEAHVQNFFQCVRTREKPHCHIDLAFRVQVAVGLAEMAYRQNKTMRFDAKKLEVL